MTWSPVPAQLACALLLSAVAALFDLKTGRIPNRLVLAGAIAGLVCAIALAVRAHGVAGSYLGALYSASGLLLCAPLPLLLYFTRSLGGGDCKLFLALGTLLGPLVGLQAQLHAFCLGSFYLIGVVIYRGALLQTVEAALAQLFHRLLPQRWRTSRPQPELDVKFGPVICAGVLLSLSVQWGSP